MKFIKMMLICLLITGVANGQSAFDIEWWSSNTGTGMGSDTLKQWAEGMEGSVGVGGVGLGTGSIFYVDSGVAIEGDGKSWTNAKDTLDEAVGLCTADRGDVIKVAEGHAGNFGAADAADLDVAGIKVIGMGIGEHRPLFTVTAAAGELVIGDASIWIENLRFMASVDSVVHIIEVEADADGFVIYNCEFMEPESASTVDEADDIIQVAAGANQGYIIGNKFYSLSAGANTAIDLTAGVIEDLTIAGNEIIGDWVEAGIYSDDIDLRHRYYGNTVQNTQTGDHAIWLNAATTGWSAGNHIITDTVAASYDAGSLQTSNTDVWSDSDTTDVVAVPIFTSETGVDIWAASQLAQIEAEVIDALETEANLSEIGDKVVADMDANSTASAIIADLQGFSELGDKVVADMDANSLLVNWTAARSLIVTDLGGISEIGDKVVADMDANSTTFYWAERTAVVTGTNNADSEDLFDIDGGAILITNFVCLVTETIDSNAATCQIIIDRDDSATDTEFTTAVTVSTDVLGTLWVFSNANPAVLTPLTPGAVGQSTLMSSWFCTEGMVESVFDVANLDGSINYYMTYRPLVTGVTVTAQ